MSEVYAMKQTTSLKDVLTWAEEMSVRVGSPSVGTEAVLIAMLLDDRSVAKQILTELGVTLDVVNNKIFDLVGFKY